VTKPAKIAIFKGNAVKKKLDGQMMLGEIDIAKVVFDPRSRDEIPQLLQGLQHIYCQVELRRQILALLEQHIVRGNTGRPGMDWWKILVLGVVRLNCNWNYDRLKEMADNHSKMREMMGHVPWFDRTDYPMQTLKDNVGLLTPELLQEINVIVVAAGHNLVKKNAGGLRARCDSFVVETNVHFPTDINLLYDAVRKSVELTARFCTASGVPGWRQSKARLQKLRGQLHFCEKLKHSTSKVPEKQTQKEQEIKTAHAAYLAQAVNLLDRVTSSAAFALMQSQGGVTAAAQAAAIDRFVADARYQLNLVKRRVLQGEVIPHAEKLFSIFEKHTEWICKGKAGTPQELGLRVGVVEDQYGFILTHQVMVKTVDSEAAESLLTEAKKRFPNLQSCSFDQGFWTPENLPKLQAVIPVPALLKKGRLSQSDRERQEAPEFRQARRGHQAVESGINALENHGLDRCPDHGLDGFKCYVALAVTARNLQKLGAELQKQERARLERSRKIKAGLERRRQAAQAA
jgi:transposase, IS5 family